MTLISIGRLESHLWEAANILRGPVDAADFKTYVFPLLFFKRISDVYDEEVSVLVDGLISMLEPMMVVLLGGIVGFIVIALFMPLIQLLNQLS